MRASSMRYLMGNGFRNLWHNRLMTIASVGTLVACLLIVGVAVLFSLNVDSMVEYVGEQNELVVFMDVGTSDEQLAQMESQLDRHVDGPGGNRPFVSSDEAIAARSSTGILDGDAGLLEGMDDDFMPASFRCQIADPEKRRRAGQAQIEGLDNVDNVQAPTEITDTLVQLRHMINIFGGAIIVALVDRLAGHHHQHHPRVGLYPPPGDQHHEICWCDQHLYPDPLCGGRDCAGAFVCRHCLPDGLGRL